MSDDHEPTADLAAAAAAATGHAFRRALRQGRSVLVADGGALWEVQPDGSRRYAGASLNKPPRYSSSGPKS